MKRDFLNLNDAGASGITAILNDALDLKAARKNKPKGAIDDNASLVDHALAMIFEKNSTRTRASFDMSIKQLGGSSMIMDAGTMQLGRGETIADTAHVLSRYVDAIMLRTNEHDKVQSLAHHATVPVINGLTDLSHPCQICADMLTMIEQGKALTGLNIAWFGDGNNVANSLIEAAGLMKFNLILALPAGCEPKHDFVTEARNVGAQIDIIRDPTKAATDADIIMTDTWVSMGQADSDKIIAKMMPYQVTDNIMALAKDDALFMHCLPAHAGKEVVQSVLDSKYSVVFDQAENRLHAQKSILRWCFGLIDCD